MYLFYRRNCKPYIVGYQNFGEGDWITTAGAAFSSVGETEGWVNTTSILGNDVIAGDTVFKFSADAWDLDSWGFKGYDAETGEGRGWAYTYTDMETWEPEHAVIASFVSKQGDTIAFQPADAISGLTVAGQVTDTSKSATWTLDAGEWIGEIMNPYPIATTFADLEAFAVEGDTIMIFNPNFWDLDAFGYKGAGKGWSVSTTDSETWEPKKYVEEDTSKIILPAGIGGVYQPADMDGRTWTVTL